MRCTTNVVTSKTTSFQKVLARESLPWPIAEVALQRHERMNSSRHPRGLAAEQIMTPARIVAVVDLVQSMDPALPLPAGVGN